MDTKIGAVDVCKPACSDVGSLPSNVAVSTIHDSIPSTFVNSSEATLGGHIARRLVQIGVTDVFTVPGDFNLTLLDHLIAEPGLTNIGCCNELNAGYAADGYARSRGVGACVVTFTVGGLSVLNAIAGAYSENLPVICIVGGPNSNDYGTNRILHHTIGLPDFTQELRCFQTVTCYQAVVNNLEDAHELIDTAISTSLKESKPVYISISCNLAGIPHPTFCREPVPFSLSPKWSNKMGLEAAVEAAAEFLNKAVKPAKSRSLPHKKRKKKALPSSSVPFTLLNPKPPCSVSKTMGASESSDTSDGPVLSLLNKRLRALRKKLNRILQMEDAIAQGKPINKEQEEVLRSKPAVSALIDELEKLRQPLSQALSEELSIAAERQQLSSHSAPASSVDRENSTDEDDDHRGKKSEPDLGVVEDLLKLLYFGSLFDVKSQSDFTATILTRTHERGCCLTYDYVTDEATDLLGEKDLDSLSSLGGFLISRPVDSGLSHKNALQRCIEHAKLWLANSDQAIESNANITYAGLRERLNKIMASDYFTTTPEMKDPVEVAAAAAAGNYASFQVPITAPTQVDCSVAEFQHTDQDLANFQEHETGDDEYSPVDELQEDEEVTENASEVVSVQREQIKSLAELEHNEIDPQSKGQQYIPRRTYQNQYLRGGRGGSGGGRQGYSNGHGGRGNGRGSGPYQNGRNQYYEQPGNYYPRNFYNNRGRGGGPSYDNHGSEVQSGHAPG